MPYITTVISSYVLGSSWEFETVTTFVSSLPSQSVDLPDDYWWDFETVTTFASSQSSQSVDIRRTSTLSTFATSTYTSMSSPTAEPLSTGSTTSRPTFTDAASLPSTLPSTAQPSNFPTGVVIGVCGAILFLLVVLISLLAWKGKLKRLNPIQNPYVTKMKRQAQDERVRKVEQERARERGWGVGNERESRIMEGGGDLPELVGVAK